MTTKKKILYIDMDGVIAGCDADYSNKQYQNKGFFDKLKPCKNAIESVKQLFNSGEFDVYFLTKPSWSVPESYMAKRIWIEKHFGNLARKRLILTHNKGLNRGDYLIDDLIDNAKGFQGEFIHFGSSFFPNWESVLNYLLKGHHTNPMTGEYYLSDIQSRAKRVIEPMVEDGKLTNRVQAVEYMRKYFPKISIDEANRVWILIHRNNPDVWSKGAVAKAEQMIDKLRNIKEK